MNPYLGAFENGAAPFLKVWRVLDSELRQRQFTRSEFLEQAHRAAAVLKHHELKPVDRCLHCFGGNRWEDLAFRLGSSLSGTVPVTVNWQADDQERVLYKLKLTSASCVIHDEVFPESILSAIRDRFPEIPIFDVNNLEQFEPEPQPKSACDSDRIIIFTSGTTGVPKGVLHSYRSYQCNADTFRSFLDLEDSDFGLFVVNPLHHANATAITDWALRDPNASLFLLERYTTAFWHLLAKTASSTSRLIVPLTARHFDFLQELEASNRLPIDLAQLRNAAEKTDILIGSAPVGPTTIQRLLKYTGRCPTVRFGSTETCLQVIGIPRFMDEHARLTAFKRGWSFKNGQQTGYFIGRPHPPFTNVRIVHQIDPTHTDFMKDCAEGETGYFITRGANLMDRYVKDPDATARVMPDGWYTGLQDVGYYLINPADGEKDFYWMSRESNLIIKGGANYACDQIAHKLKQHLLDTLEVSEDAFDLAVVGLRIDSEHEDACCITVSLEQSEWEQAITDALESSKWVDHLRFGPIPRNFKGAIVAPELKQAFEDHLKKKS